MSGAGDDLRPPRSRGEQFALPLYCLQRRDTPGGLSGEFDDGARDVHQPEETGLGGLQASLRRPRVVGVDGGPRVFRPRWAQPLRGKRWEGGWNRNEG